MPLAFRCFTLCSLCAQPAVVTVQSEHFNSLSALLCLYRPTEGCCPPLSCVSLHKGYWTCWMWWGRKGNKGGGNLLNKVGRTVLKAAENKDEPNTKHNDFIQICARITLKLLLFHAGKSPAMVNNHTVICVFTKAGIIPLREATPTKLSVSNCSI